MLMMSLHSMVHRQTGLTPNRMMLGREVLQPLDLILGTLDRERLKTPSSEWVQQLAETLDKVHQFVRKNLRTTQARQKRDYDLRIHEHQFQVGDLVYRRDSSTKVGAKALKPLWKGHYVIIRAMPPLYKLQDRRRVGVWHHDKLKLCRDRQVPFWLRRLRNRVLSQEEEGEDLEEPEPVLDNPNLDVLERDWRIPIPDAEVPTPPTDQPGDQPADELSEPDADSADQAEPEVEPASVQPEVEPDQLPLRRSRRGRTIQRPSYLDEYELDLAAYY